jgi:hypothetical protein
MELSMDILTTTDVSLSLELKRSFRHDGASFLKVVREILDYCEHCGIFLLRELLLQ